MADIRTQLTPTWLEEIGAGFPPGSVGQRLQAIARAEGRLPPVEIVEQHGEALLSSLQLDATIAFSEFLAGNAFTDAERDDLRTTLRMDFVANPFPSLAALSQVVGAFVQIPAMEPERRAMERLGAQAATKFTERRAGTTTSVTALIERYNPVVHIDDDELIITADALDAYWSLYDTIAEITGVDPSTSEDQVALSAQLSTVYSNWPRRIRSETAYARGRWVALRASIRAMDDDRYDEFVDHLTSEVTDPTGVAAAVTGFGMAAGAAATARRISRRLVAAATETGPATGTPTGTTADNGTTAAVDDGTATTDTANEGADGSTPAHATVGAPPEASR
ncbi:MAG: hypothetical protein AAF962_17050 [Actinomycetota bacterium]